METQVDDGDCCWHIFHDHQERPSVPAGDETCVDGENDGDETSTVAGDDHVDVHVHDNLLLTDYCSCYCLAMNLN